MTEINNLERVYLSDFFKGKNYLDLINLMLDCIENPLAPICNGSRWGDHSRSGEFRASIAANILFSIKEIDPKLYPFLDPYFSPDNEEDLPFGSRISLYDIFYEPLFLLENFSESIYWLSEGKFKWYNEQVMKITPSCRFLPLVDSKIAEGLDVIFYSKNLSFHYPFELLPIKLGFPKSMFPIHTSEGKKILLDLVSDWRLNLKEYLALVENYRNRIIVKDPFDKYENAIP